MSSGIVSFGEPAALACVTVEKLGQFVIGALRLFGVAGAQSLSGAMLQMVFHQDPFYRAQ
jgi:hypothetical protein